MALLQTASLFYKMYKQDKPDSLVLTSILILVLQGKGNLVIWKWLQQKLTKMDALLKQEPNSNVKCQTETEPFLVRILSFFDLNGNQNVMHVSACKIKSILLKITTKIKNCSKPGSSIHGIFQARMLEWVAVPSSSGSFQPRD